jgi:hypothetical protein
MGLRARLSCVLLSLVAMPACSNGTDAASPPICDGGGAPSVNSFTATPNNLPDGGGSVTLAWNATEADSLSIDQGVGTVSPVTIGNTVVQVTRFTTFTLSAMNSNGSRTAAAQVTVSGPVDVSGRVVDGNNGPFPGQIVAISSGAFNQSLVTDASGTFTVANVPTPYNATLLNITPDPYGLSPDEQLAIEYVGLTRSDPTLIAGLLAASLRAATLSGEILGGRYPEPPGYSTTMQFESTDDDVFAVSAPEPTSGSYSQTLSWEGPASTMGTLYAVQTHTDLKSGLPIDYPGYGQLSGLMLADGMTQANGNVTFAPVTTCTLSLTVSLPAGYTQDLSKELALLAAPGVILPLATNYNGGTTLSYLTPEVPGTSLLVSAGSYDDTGSGASGWIQNPVPANTGTVTLTVPVPPALLLPLDSATGVTVSTPFSWTPFAGGVHRLMMVGAFQTLFIYTASATATIPDLSDAGFRFPSNYLWEVSGMAPMASIDAMVAPGSLDALGFGDFAAANSAQRYAYTSP